MPSLSLSQALADSRGRVITCETAWEKITWWSPGRHVRWLLGSVGSCLRAARQAGSFNLRIPSSRLGILSPSNNNRIRTLLISHFIVAPVKSYCLFISKCEPWREDISTKKGKFIWRFSVTTLYNMRKILYKLIALYIYT